MTKYTYQKLADKFGHEHIVIGKNKVVKSEARMKSYWVIFEESIWLNLEDKRFEMKAIGCRDKEVAAKHILQHPEAIIIYGKRQKISIVPEHIEWEDVK